jgi:hypothetical protein
MALVIKDRVKQTTTTTGTGTLTLNGTVSGFQTFAAALSDGDTTYYSIFEPSTNNWEVGLGTWTEGSSLLARTTILASSNSGSAINLTAQAEVFISQPAGKAAFFNADGDLELNRDPQTALQAATKEYVDTIAAAGLHYHDPVRVEKEGNLSATYDNGTAGVGATLTNNSTQAALVIDGVTLSLNDRVLIYEQTDATQNGVYTVTDTGSASTNWVLTRSTDTDSYAPSDPNSFGKGDAFFVLEGNAGAGELYVMNTEGTITFGTTNITFTQVASTAVYSAGNGLTLTGTVFAADAGTGVTVDGSGINIGQAVETTSDVTFNSVTASLSGNVTGNVTGDVTGNADTATALQTARNIGGVSFDGTASINLPGVNTAGNQDTSGNAATATAWATGRTISLTGDVTGSVAGVDGTGNASIATTIQPNSVALSTDTTGNYVQSVASGNYITGGAAGSEGAALTIGVDATPNNTASKVVARDASGNFSAGTITADGLTIDSTTQTSFNVEYADDGAGIGPLLRTFRDSASPAVADALGGIDFKGNNSAGTEKFYARIKGVIIDPADTTEDGAVEISVSKAGTAAWETSALVAKFDPNGMELRGDLRFEGATANNSETTLTVTDPTADRTITLPDASGTAVLSTTLIEGTSFSGTYPVLFGIDNATGRVFENNNILYNGTSNVLTISGNTVWHAGNDGTGSGLDADTVDGIQASSFLRSDASDTATGAITIASTGGGALTLKDTNGAGTSAASWIDFDDSSDVRVGYVGMGSTSNGNNFLYAVAGSPVLGSGNASAPQYYNGSGYTTIWHSGNDGSGSGLDADTLDGVQGSSYLRSDASDTFTTLSGTQLNIGSQVQLAESSDRADLLQITSSTSAWGGLQIRNSSNEGRWSFMTDGEVAGIYNDEDNQWHIYMTELGGVDLRHAATSRINTTSSGANVTGTLTTDGLTVDGTTTLNGTLTLGANVINDVEDIYLRDRIYHDGDTDTYFQFHTANQARIVCAGGEVMEWGANYAKLSDNDSLYFGSGTDFRILHNGTNNYIQNRNHAAGDIYIQGEDTSGVNHNMAAFYSSNANPYVGLYYDGTEVFTTVSGGVNINGNINAVDNIYLAGNLYHEGDTDTRLDFGTNAINLRAGNQHEMQVTQSGVFLINSALHEDYDALSGTSVTIDPNTGGAWSLTMTGNTTFTFGATTNNYSVGLIVELTGNGGTVTWPASVDWAGGTAPDAPASGETDIYVFWTRDGGTTWYGVQSIDAAA